MGYIRDLHVVKDLHVSLCHIHPDIVLRLLEISSSRFKVQLTELDLIRNLETREDGHRGSKLKRRITGVGVRVGIICRQTTSEGEVLSEAATEIRKPGVLSRREIELPLTARVLLLLDADVMLHGIVAALPQAPLLLRPCSTGSHRQAQKQAFCYHHSVHHIPILF